MVRRFLLVAAAVGALAGCGRQRPLTVGAKNYTEQAILAEIVAQHLEQRLALKVVRRLNLDGTLVAHQALLTGEIDLYPEYSGAALTAILRQPPDADPGRVFERVRLEYRTRLRLEWLDPLGFDSAFAMVVRGAEARARGLETLSQAAGYQPGWTLGAGGEFLLRPDGYLSLMRTYNMPWRAEAKTMDFASLYRALAEGRISMAAGTATDGWLAARDLRVLRDDKGAFPPNQAALAVRADALARFSGLRRALEELSGKFPETVMRGLNYQADVDKRPVSEVAGGFLRQAGLAR